VSFWRAETYREQAESLRVRAAEATSTDMRKDLENIALQYELVAERIETMERRGLKPKGSASGVADSLTANLAESGG
jgi:hypothetical protein